MKRREFYEEEEETARQGPRLCARDREGGRERDNSVGGEREREIL